MVAIEAPQPLERSKLILAGGFEFRIFDLDARLFLPGAIIEWEVSP